MAVTRRTLRWAWDALCKHGVVSLQLELLVSLCYTLWCRVLLHLLCLLPAELFLRTARSIPAVGTRFADGLQGGPEGEVRAPTDCGRQRTTCKHM